MMGWIKNLPNSTVFWLALAATVVVFSIGLAAVRWDWLRSGAGEEQWHVSTESTTVTETIVTTESNSTTVRNTGFLIAGALALVFAVWRGVLSQRQAKTAERQAETALRQTETAQLQVGTSQYQAETSQRQTEIAQQGLLNERYQRGAEMLGSEVLTVRLGGIYALQRLAEEHPEQYHVQVMRQLCAFVRHPAEVDGQPTIEQEEYSVTREEILAIHPDATDLPPILPGKRFKPREDIQVATEAIAFCHDRNQKVETDNSYWLDLHGADLRGVNLSNMNLARASWNIELVGSFYHLIAVGRYTDMRETKLDDASLIMTDLTGVDLSGSIGLTQTSFDLATFDSEKPPKLDNVLDPKTGEQLVWRGRPLDDDSAEPDA